MYACPASRNRFSAGNELPFVLSLAKSSFITTYEINLKIDYIKNDNKSILLVLNYVYDFSNTYISNNIFESVKKFCGIYAALFNQSVLWRNG